MTYFRETGRETSWKFDRIYDTRTKIQNFCSNCNENQRFEITMQGQKDKNNTSEESNMVSKEEIERVIKWCEDLKEERQRIYIIERNPFRDEIDWTRRFPLIEIDRAKDVASKHNLLYDSTTKTLWQFFNGSWRKIEPDVRIGRV
jgi:hypothetical protein